MKNVYAVLNSSEQIVDRSESSSCPQGFIKMNEERPTPQHIATENGEWVLNLAKIKDEYISQTLYPIFEAEKNKIVWFDSYGFDCDITSNTNWLTAVKIAEMSENNLVDYKVWLSEKQKGFVILTYKQLLEVASLVRKQQISAYDRFQELKQEVLLADSQEKIDSINWCGA